MRPRPFKTPLIIIISITANLMMVFFEHSITHAAYPIGQVLKMPYQELQRFVTTILAQQQISDGESQLMATSLRLAFGRLPIRATLIHDLRVSPGTILDRGISTEAQIIRQIAAMPVDQLTVNDLVDLVNLSASEFKRHSHHPTPKISLSRGLVTKRMLDIGVTHLLIPTDPQAVVYLRSIPLSLQYKRQKILLLSADYLEYVENAIKNIPPLLLDSYYVYWRKFNEGTTQEKNLAHALLPLAISDRQERINFLAYELLTRNMETLDKRLLQELTHHIEQYEKYKGPKVAMPDYHRSLILLAHEMDNLTLEAIILQLLGQ